VRAVRVAVRAATLISIARDPEQADVVPIDAIFGGSGRRR
jgi:hypothetical protein